jgi:ADP-heptose:LPS heptosyltransferase
VRYLIPEFTGIGDLIQKTPLIQSIAEIDQAARIFLIGDNRWKGLDIVKDSSLIEETCNVVEMLRLELPRNYTNTTITKSYERLRHQKKRTLSDWLRRIEWDVYFDSCHSDVPPIISRLVEQSGTGKIYRHADIDKWQLSDFWQFLKGRRRSTSIGLVPILKGRHDIDSNYDLLEAYLDYPFERHYDTWVAIRNDDDLLNRWGLHKNEYVCLQPGAANGAPTPKTWHPKNFVELSRKLNESFGKKVVLLGDRGDHEQIISKHEWPETVINTATETSIQDVGGIISKAACVIAHDSGIMHLANAMRVPLVALYGPTDYTATRPCGEHNKILFSKTPAFAVMYRSTISEKKLAEKYPNHEAMASISVDQVMCAVDELLAEHQNDR